MSSREILREQLLGKLTTLFLLAYINCIEGFYCNISAHAYNLL
jgi:hypothetical protein